MGVPRRNLVVVLSCGEAKNRFYLIIYDYLKDFQLGVNLLLLLFYSTGMGYS